MLKIDTIISLRPVGAVNNSDHYITGRAVEAAYTSPLDYPEQLDVVEPHGLSERYYFTRRGPQLHQQDRGDSRATSIPRSEPTWST